MKRMLSIALLGISFSAFAAQPQQPEDWSTAGCAAARNVSAALALVTFSAAGKVREGLPLAMIFGGTSAMLHSAINGSRQMRLTGGATTAFGLLLLTSTK